MAIVTLRALPKRQRATTFNRESDRDLAVGKRRCRNRLRDLLPVRVLYTARVLR